MSAPNSSILPERVGRLGTETAFAVSAEAAAHAAKGNIVYPFHLGDMNLPTPRNIQEAAVRAMQDGKTGYCPNGGIPALREALAAETAATHRISLGPENVAVQPGGKPVIEKFLLALVNPGDEVLYPNPGFPIYESQIEFQGAKAVPYGFVPGEENFLLDFDAIQTVHHATHASDHLQRPAEPNGRGQPPTGDRGGRGAGLEARSLRPQR